MTVSYIKELPDCMRPIVEKQFDIIGADKGMELVDGWYSSHTWTKEQENEFRDWFIEYHTKGDGKNGRGILPKYAKRKADVERAWREYNLLWGWKGAE